MVFNYLRTGCAVHTSKIGSTFQTSTATKSSAYVLIANVTLYKKKIK